MNSKFEQNFQESDDMDYKFAYLVSRLDEINKRLRTITFSSKIAKDYVTESFVRTVMLHVSYLYFYGVTNYWCNQLNTFYLETLDLKKSERGKKVDNKYIYNLITKSKIYTWFTSDNGYVKKFVSNIPTTEKGTSLKYNIPLDVESYKKYLTSFISFLFDNEHTSFESEDIKDFALKSGCVDTEK